MAVLGSWFSVLGSSFIMVVLGRLGSPSQGDNMNNWYWHWHYILSAAVLLVKSMYWLLGKSTYGAAQRACLALLGHLGHLQSRFIPDEAWNARRSCLCRRGAHPTVGSVDGLVSLSSVRGWHA